MYELGLIEDLISTVEDGVGGAKVHLVRLVVGKASCASPHALQFAFELCTHGTPLEGATLDIVETPGEDLRLSEVEVT
jgi:hydrogenase nickel incorporation protein HypA/HybF